MSARVSPVETDDKQLDESITLLAEAILKEAKTLFKNETIIREFTQWQEARR